MARRTSRRVSKRIVFPDRITGTACDAFEQMPALHGLAKPPARVPTEKSQASSVTDLIFDAFFGAFRVSTAYVNAMVAAKEGSISIERHGSGCLASVADIHDKWIAPDSLIRQIDRIVSNDDQYGDGEPQPAAEVVKTLKRLITEAGVATFPPTEVGLFYGEVSLTWRRNTRLLRLVVRPSGEALVYFQVDGGATLTRGQTAPIASGAELKARLEWLSER